MAMRPRLAHRVLNHLTRDGGDIEVELPLGQLWDFEPDNLVQQIIRGQPVAVEDRKSIYLTALDKRLSAQLTAMTDAPAFRRLEASSRGMHYLVRESKTSTRLKIRVLNASKEGLRRVRERSRAFDQNSFFKKVYKARSAQASFTAHSHQGCLDVAGAMPSSESCPGSI
jgi:EvpB/VC_A0108, tail sheath N-terminal domain/Type VI secretion system, VipA, VC_A0107 or Hcp2